MISFIKQKLFVVLVKIKKCYLKLIEFFIMKMQSKVFKIDYKNCVCLDLLIMWLLNIYLSFMIFKIKNLVKNVLIFSLTNK